MAGPLDLNDLVSGLREVVQRAHTSGIHDVSIRIVGGAALRIAHFERATTADIDAQIQPLDQLEPIIGQIASERDWPADWLNDKATLFIPRWGRSVEWESLFDDENVSIWVAPVDALLAMKLNAARPGRDTDDIVHLLVLNDIFTVASAERLFEDFYPGDALTERAILLLERIFARGLPGRPSAPPRADFS
ncbi:DUF6036 family nucleotidyltransferase [Cryobacterium sp. HLT2-28]|uniref:DUF6036 family nucleotidyltransferase n=1 Tax=Cryobacterium sp. HLT2-28 TaxID=1259146 RepID=UPI00106BB69E|nr:DUF6036 family nucleotidyltransferase [Cryobacterium sp. HLT2-28]TFB94544.1 hypothetical protein E3O48_07990 [Cryobacterium sp. HLT2-28]